MELDPTVLQRQADRESTLSRFPALGRGVADIRDKVTWAKRRSNKIGASDAARYAKIESWPLYLKGKLYQPFQGNSYTQHGNEREPVILNQFHVLQNSIMFESADDPRHVATPDGIVIGATELLLVQVKTTMKPLWKIPPTYQRQMWWEQYVMGTDRTVFAWELLDRDGKPSSMEPESDVFYRDDEQISKLITIANLVLAGMDSAAQFRNEMEQN